MFSKCQECSMNPLVGCYMYSCLSNTTVGHPIMVVILSKADKKGLINIQNFQSWDKW